MSDVVPYLIIVSLAGRPNRQRQGIVEVRLCGFPLFHGGFGNSPDESASPFSKGQFVCKAALKQHAYGMIAGHVGCRSQSHILTNAKVNEVNGLGQNEEVPGNRILNFTQLPAEVLDKYLLKT
ncbi:MAG TPA: hypothetical protein VHP11_15370, partial [Tepidisphaeraceae bacterium]|nr:hypothetical protein [Tepidisphaeraceae bacterium]